MTRRNFVIFAVCLYGCGTRVTNLQTVLPENVPGGWVREQMRPMAAEDAVELVRQLGLSQWAQASYRHDTKGRLTVEIYEMKAGPSAFELQQKFHEPQTATFYTGSSFVVVKRSTGDPANVQEFARALESSIKKT